MTKIEVDTLIIGAGLIGSSVAMHLAKQMAEQGGKPELGSIRVVDFDLEGTFSSSELNAGGVRATWIQPVNILCSKLSIDYFATVAQEVGYRDCGYLWLHKEDRFKKALEVRKTQQELGWTVEAWDVAELRRKVPFIDKTDDLAGAIFAPKDGLVNPNRLKNHFREKAGNLNVTFDDRIWIKSAEYFTVGGEKRVSIKADLFLNKPVDLDGKLSVLTQKHHDLKTRSVEYVAKRVINCAGAWAPEIAKMLKYSCPSEPVRRQVCIFDCKEVDLNQYGMIVDTSGVYFHPEAMNGLAGYANEDEPLGFNFNYDNDEFFMEKIWAPLYERATAFERLKHVTGWAGLYEVSPDHCSIIGRVENGEAGKYGEIFEAHSFSGHGVMHCYAAGLGLAELITLNKYQTIDLKSLSAKRFETNQLVHENWVI